MFKRELDGRLPRSSFFLFGPRQVGKTTLLKQEKHDLSIDLLDPELQLTYNKDPNLLARQVAELSPDAAVLIDEVQRVPRLLDVVHALMEKRPQTRFILCGSSARRLRHGAFNLLGGRALYRTLHPLTARELGSAFDLETVLAYGSLPRISAALMEKKTAEARDRLRAYVITYVKEEIKAEALVRNLHGFQNFLDVAAAQYAEQVNFSGIARDCQVALATVREYYSILEDTLIGFTLMPFLKSRRKRMSHQPKFYFFDNGVTRALLGTLQEGPHPSEKGRLFEQWIIQELVRINEYRQKDWQLSFWRTSHGAEVDVLISRGNRVLFAIECAFTRSPASRDVSGLRSFRETYPKTPCFVVAPVPHPLKLDGFRVLPPLKLFDELLDY